MATPVKTPAKPAAKPADPKPALDKEPVEKLTKSPNLLMADITDDKGGNGGAIKIADSVIAAVVRKYVLEVPGVVRFATTSPLSGLAEMLGRRTSEGSIVVNIENESLLNIAVTLVLEFGVRIPEVAGLVQNVITTKVEEITGKHVAAVNVIVQDMVEEVAPKKEGEVKAEAGDDTERQAAGQE